MRQKKSEWTKSNFIPFLRAIACDQKNQGHSFSIKKMKQLGRKIDSFGLLANSHDGNFQQNENNTKNDLRVKPKLVTYESTMCATVLSLAWERLQSCIMSNTWQNFEEIKKIPDIISRSGAFLLQFSNNNSVAKISITMIQQKLVRIVNDERNKIVKRWEQMQIT